MRGSAASLPGRSADCCRKIGSGARYTPVTGSRTQSSFRRQREQEVATRRSEFARHPEERRRGRLIAALNRKIDILTATSAKYFQSPNLTSRPGSSKVNRFPRSGCTVAIETERGIDSLTPATELDRASGMNQTDGSHLLFFRRPRGSGGPGLQTHCRPALGARFRGHDDNCVQVSSVRI